MTVWALIAIFVICIGNHSIILRPVRMRSVLTLKASKKRQDEEKPGECAWFLVIG
jgi:hypothetical protein